MKLAHLILAHNNPLQLERLVKRLASPRSDIYIHLDSKTDYESFAFIAAIPQVRFINNRTDVRWGNYSMVEATLRSFVEILDTEKIYSHINLLSGHDYLLKDISQIEDFFFDHAGKSFMHYYAIDREWPEGKIRLSKYNLGDWETPFKYLIQEILNRVMPARRVPLKMVPYGFSQWITITPSAAQYVLYFLATQPLVMHYFQYTWGVDEFIFQTILLNSPFKDKVVNNNHRYIVFEKGAVNPNVLTMADAPAMIASGKFFARKFESQEYQESQSTQTQQDLEPNPATKILDYLDQIAIAHKGA